LGIDRCARERTPRAPQQLVPVPSPVRPAGTPPSTPGSDGPPHDDHPRWWRDPLVLSTGGLGLAAVGVGVAALVASDRSADRAQSRLTTSHAEFHRLWSEAEQRRTISIVGLAAGAGLVAVGGVRALWLWRHQGQTSDTAPRLSLTAGTTGAPLLWEGRF